MPNLGFDAQTGRLVEWLKKAGDSVRKGEVLAVIESDKANVELESIAEGTVLALLCEAGEELAIGTVIARIGTASEYEENTPTRKIDPSSLQPPASSVEVSPVARRLMQEKALNPAEVRGTGPRGRITREDVEQHLQARALPTHGEPLALPKVRKLAREMGIDLRHVPPSGARGQVTLQDLQSYQRSTTAPTTIAPAVLPSGVTPPPVPLAIPAGAQEISLSRVRTLIGERLGKSMREAPHFYVTGEFDLEAALSALKTLPEPRPRLNDLVQYLAVQALLAVPELNATFEEGRLFQHQNVNLAIAVARDEGLMTPVLHGAERLSLVGLMHETTALVKRARENRLQAQDMQGGTFTISNLGVIKQVEQFTAVINPPQVAILAVGTVKQRPVVIEGGLFAHHTVKLTLSGDHRVVDGMHLGRYMAAYQDALTRFVKSAT
jgi:pyruvate dehydrogenase E2 component (dihydrolipoamide acetyltransferase)